MAIRIGFLGFGEAGSTIATGLSGEGVTDLVAYDVAASDPERARAFARRARAAGVALVESPAALAASADVIFSVVVVAVAVAAAKDVAPHLEERHIYVDMNSASPQVKREVATVVEDAGARFVEAAVMGGVLMSGHRVPMLLCGRAAGELRERMTPLGMRMEVLGDEIGAASATKLFRSTIVKGLEALILECLLGARAYGVDERVLRSLNVDFIVEDWGRIADYLMGRTALHGERRAHEMEEVAKALDAIGEEPIMARAAARRLAWGTRFGLKDRFADRTPARYGEVLDAIEEGRDDAGRGAVHRRGVD